MRTISITSTFFLSAALMFGVVAFASATESTTTNTDTIACVKDAVSERETTLGEGWEDFSGEVANAYSQRKSALAEAYSSGDVKEIKNAVKDAWSEFKSSVKEARADWKKVRKDAWSEFKADRKACRAGNIVDDSTNQSSDAQ